MAPCLANPMPTSRPMPLLPPVMMATLPVRSTGGGTRVGRRRPKGMESIDSSLSRTAPTWEAVGADMILLLLWSSDSMLYISLSLSISRLVVMNIGGWLVVVGFKAPALD